jgi:DNA-binding NarL/FixJ family response regulator
MIRVLIVDDHQLVRQGIVALLIKAKDIKIVGEARDGIEAIELTERLFPDIILMDLEMPRLDGLRATARLKSMGMSARIIILSMKMDERDVRLAAQNGAHGYLVKNISREELIAAIRSVHEGHSVSSPAVAPYFSGRSSLA